MFTLNLIDSLDSELKFELKRHEDGHHQVKIKAPSSDLLPLKGEHITIESRLNHFTDLELIICATKSLRLLGYKNIHLFVPYVLGSEDDIMVEPGTNNYLRDVICPIINSLNFDSVSVLDPHSDVLEACLQGFNRVDRNDILRFAFEDLARVSHNSKGCVILAPGWDNYKKTVKAIAELDYEMEVILCPDTTNDAGEFEYRVPLNFEHLENDIVVISDICTRAKPFFDIGIKVKNLKEAAKIKIDESSKITLIVTHGIFTEGYLDLSRVYSRFYFTNSISKIHNAFLTTYKIKQLDLF